MAFLGLLRSFLAAHGFSDSALLVDGSGARLQGRGWRVDIVLAESGDAVCLSGSLGTVPEDPVLRLRVFDGLMQLQGIGPERPHLSFGIAPNDQGEDEVLLLRSFFLAVVRGQAIFDALLTDFLGEYEALNEHLLLDLLRATPPVGAPAAWRRIH
jgi:hypothetical protein